MSEIFSQIEAVIQARQQSANPDSSYVAALLNAGTDRILKKIGEEATETNAGQALEPVESDSLVGAEFATEPSGWLGLKGRPQATELGEASCLGPGKLDLNVIGDHRHSSVRKPLVMLVRQRE